MHDLRERVLALNAAWRERRFDDLRAYFDPEVVIAAPGFGAHVKGRDAVVESYREFAENATIDVFDLSEPAIDIWGDTAVVTAPYSITYSMHGRTYREHGHDLLVFRRTAGEWLILWRTLTSGEV